MPFIQMNMTFSDLMRNATVITIRFRALVLQYSPVTLPDLMIHAPNKSFSLTVTHSLLSLKQLQINPYDTISLCLKSRPYNRTYLQHSTSHQ